MRSKINSRYCFIKQPTRPKRNNNQSGKQVINCTEFFQNNHRCQQSDSFLTPGVLKGKRTLVDIKTEPYPFTIHACISVLHPLTVFPDFSKILSTLYSNTIFKFVSQKMFHISVSRKVFHKIIFFAQKKIGLNRSFWFIKILSKTTNFAGGTNPRKQPKQSDIRLHNLFQQPV